MKLFDGINKYTYQTIYGKIELTKCEHGVVYKLHDEVSAPNIRMIANGRLWQMRFDNRVQALKKLLEMEKNTMMSLMKFMKEEV